MTSRQTAATRLEEILTWRLEPWTPRETLSSPRLDENRGSSGTPLPYADDDLTQGAYGVETYAGVEAWLKGTAAWVEYWTGQPMRGQSAGAYILNQLQTSPYLDNGDVKPIEPIRSDYEDTADYLASWEDYDAQKTWNAEWERFTRELNRLWNFVGRVTGHMPLRRALCPQCHTGHLQSAATPTGYEDTATCSNPTCRLTIDHHHNEIAASIRAALRTPDINADVWLTAAQIKTIWPTLNSATLRSWVHRGKVAKHQDLYNLADINQQQVDKLGHPC